MIVVLDNHPNSRAGLTIAQRYSRGLVALASWDSATDHIDADVRASVTAEPTIAEALRVATERRAPWVAIRRDFAEPKQLLSELLVAAAQNTHEEMPGFAVILADGDPAPFRRILAIVDQRSGAISGLAAYVAVAAADSSGAELDILVLGHDGGEAGSVDSPDQLAVSREHEYLQKARDRARSGGVSVNWLSATDADDPWPVLQDQLSQHDYDLVIDDLGDVSFGRPGSLRRAMKGEVDLGALGEIPLRLLTETPTPLLLVIDEIRLGMAPQRLLKLGTVAAIALGTVASPTAVSGIATTTAEAASEDEAEALADELAVALGMQQSEEESAEALAEERAAAAAASSRGGSDEGAREESESDADSGEDTEKPKKAKAPKGGATPSQVQKAQKSANEDKQALDKQKDKQKKAKKSLAETEEDYGTAQEAAESALSELNAAALSYTEAERHAEQVTARTTGVTSVLPGGPQEAEVDAAVQMEQSAAERLDRAIATGETALEDLATAESDLAEAEEKLASRKEKTKESKAEYEQSKQKADVYKASLAETRQSPVAKGYNLTARYGATGGYWSSGVHTGLDFAAPAGTDILAAASGTVVYAGWDGAYGNKVVIDHGDGYVTTYAHLSRIKVSPGQKVQTGDHIGDMGSTGNSTGSHLHFEVEKNGKFIDPEAWLGW
jgi:murein DD-endopeptidase MepM/ murein hydrolase activator NlpD